MYYVIFQHALPKAWQESMPLEQKIWLGKVLYRHNAKTGKLEITSHLQMWWYPPEPAQVHSRPPGSPDPYFLVPFFLWAPQKIWRLDLRCNEECKAKHEEQEKQVCYHKWCFLFHCKLFGTKRMLNYKISQSQRLIRVEGQQGCNIIYTEEDEKVRANH